MLLVLLAAVALIAFLIAQRSRELFVISVRRGRALVVRGRVPSAFLHDADAIVARPTVRAATIRAVRGENHARLVVTGDIDERQAQRLRNVFGLRPMAQLRTARRVGRSSADATGQLLGIAWLAWMLDRR